MQKLELRNTLFEIKNSLRSQDLVNVLESQNIDRPGLINLSINSKAHYDKSLVDPDKAKILNQLKANQIYETSKFGALLTFISTAHGSQNNVNSIAKTTLFGNVSIADFYSFHKALLNTFDLTDKVLIDNSALFDQNGAFDIKKAEEEGNVLLQAIDNQDITTSRFSIIMDAITKLTEAIYLYLSLLNIDEDHTPAKIILIDSGSDINIVISLPKKAALIVTQLLKEFWEFIANHKTYRLDKNMNAIERSLTTLTKLKEAKDAGSIDEASALRIQEDIINNAEKLIKNNTLPKQIVVGSRVVTNRDLLMNQNNSYLLNDSTNTSESLEYIKKR